MDLGTDPEPGRRARPRRPVHGSSAPLQPLVPVPASVAIAPRLTGGRAVPPVARRGAPGDGGACAEGV